MVDSVEILNLLKFGERINLECKKAESKLPASVWETYSSFANTDGGVILFGVEEHMKETDAEKRFSFVSIHNPEQRLKDFWNTVNSEKVSTNIRLMRMLVFVKLWDQQSCGFKFLRQIIDKNLFILTEIL